ncbi:polysaccharide deacetylase family protein [bacterium]|nr:polysaccharide deacetylase family protein [bacterium]
MRAGQKGEKARRIILAFHKVDPRFEWGLTRVTPRQFRLMLAFLQKRGIRVVPIREDGGASHKTQENTASVVLSFDDSYESLYAHAFPAMRERGYPGIVFVVTGHVGGLNTWDVNLGWRTFRHLSWEQMREMMQSGIQFGSHTVHHPDLTRSDDRTIRRELEYSKKELEDRLGAPVEYISYPFGRFNRRVVEISRECGYRNGCAFWNRIGREREPYVLERKAVYLLDGRFGLDAKISRRPWSFIENIKLRLINFGSHGTAVVKGFGHPACTEPDARSR